MKYDKKQHDNNHNKSTSTHIQEINEHTVKGQQELRARIWTSLGSESKSGAKMTNQVVQNKFLNVPDRDSDKKAPPQALLGQIGTKISKIVCRHRLVLPKHCATQNRDHNARFRKYFEK
jgi:hypothetical protein